MKICTHVHKHTCFICMHKRAHSHVYEHTCLHMHTQTCTFTCTHMHAATHVYGYICICTYLCAHTTTDVDVSTCIHIATYLCAGINAWIYAHKHIQNSHACAQTCTHKKLYMCIQHASDCPFLIGTTDTHMPACMHYLTTTVHWGLTRGLSVSVTPPLLSWSQHGLTDRCCWLDQGSLRAWTSRRAPSQPLIGICQR